MCKDCRKYTVSCMTLEGFECCKCCGITECEDDICPPEEKIHSKTDRTVYEFHTQEDVSFEIGDIKNGKDAFIEGKYDKFYHRRVVGARRKLRKLRKEIKLDNKLSDRVRVNCLKEIRCALISSNHLYNYIKAKLYKDKNYLKKTTFNYIKKHLDRFSSKSIGRNEMLSRGERKILLKKKGVDNPLLLIK